MRSALPIIAAEIGAPERTLRRAAGRGTVRCRRPGARTLELPVGELEYLRDHWTLLSSLVAALRTEPNVALAVVYGSTARGNDRSDSDLDVLVSLRADAAHAASSLAERLERVVKRPVDLARLSRVSAEAPLLLLQVIDEGRVLVDRDGIWKELRARRQTVVRAARRRVENQRADAARSLQRLLEEEF
jgi:predicted nucleotidyltransferase